MIDEFEADVVARAVNRLVSTQFRVILDTPATDALIELEVTSANRFEWLFMVGLTNSEVIGSHVVKFFHTEHTINVDIGMGYNVGFDLSKMTELDLNMLSDGTWVLTIDTPLFPLHQLQVKDI